jgi:hypothetical protein
MAARSQDRAKDSAVLDAVETVQQAEADAERRAAKAREQKVNPSPQGVPPDHDSPKRHGDKMEHAARAAAGLAEKG